VADTVNQGFLLVGLRASKRDPDEEHPFGHGQDQFFWSFLVAVLIFFAGGGSRSIRASQASWASPQITALS
jgi:divalent metal cation (Fe/Co/Zn/Cd) transporter